MNKGKFTQASPKRFPWLYLLVAVAILGVALCFILKGCNAPRQDTTATTVEKNPDSIAIPGYEMLELKAGSKTQTISLPNPPENCCYFQITLYLEDGTPLWQSDLIKPGKTSKPILLTQALEKGMYPNAVLRYSCFTLDENLSHLNGAETKLTLWVK